jgi:hypothetical protein
VTLSKFGARLPDQTKPGSTLPVSGTLRPKYGFSGSEPPNYEEPPNYGVRRITGFDGRPIPSSLILAASEHPLIKLNPGDSQV